MRLTRSSTALASRVRRHLTMLGLVFATAIPCAWAGFAWMFTARASYDDEGFFLMSLKAFDARQDLYARFVTSYGAAYHEAAGVLFFILRLPFDLNAARTHRTRALARYGVFGGHRHLPFDE